MSSTLDGECSESLFQVHRDPVAPAEADTVGKLIRPILAIDPVYAAYVGGELEKRPMETGGSGGLVFEHVMSSLRDGAAQELRERRSRIERLAARERGVLVAANLEGGGGVVLPRNELWTPPAGPILLASDTMEPPELRTRSQDRTRIQTPRHPRRDIPVFFDYWQVPYQATGYQAHPKLEKWMEFAEAYAGTYHLLGIFFKARLKVGPGYIRRATLLQHIQGNGFMPEVDPWAGQVVRAIFSLVPRIISLRWLVPWDHGTGDAIPVDSPNELTLGAPYHIFVQFRSQHEQALKKALDELEKRLDQLEGAIEHARRFGAQAGAFAMRVLREYLKLDIQIKEAIVMGFLTAALAIVEAIGGAVSGLLRQMAAGEPPAGNPTIA